VVGFASRRGNRHGIPLVTGACRLFIVRSCGIVVYQGRIWAGPLKESGNFVPLKPGTKGDVAPHPITNGVRPCFLVPVGLESFARQKRRSRE